MKISQVKKLIENLKSELKDCSGYYSPERLVIQYKNLLDIIRSFLSEHSTFIDKAYRTTESKNDILSSLDYLEIIMDMKVEELNEKALKKPKNFLDSARDKLNQAGIAFKSKDYSGVSNKLNTAVELALKDALDIPSTIKGINTSKIIDILISSKLGPVDYLREVKIHVLMDNLVKHQGMSPVESRAVTAIAAVENLFKKLKDPISINEEVKDKIWSDVN